MGWMIRFRFPTMTTSPQRPDRLWGPPSFLSNGYWGLFPRDKAAGTWR